MAEGESGVPLVGSRISLISKKDIRYEGVLYNINTSDASLALQNVRSYGTESRVTDVHIAASDKTFDFVSFRGQDIKDLHVHDVETESQAATRQPPQAPPPHFRQPPPPPPGPPPPLLNPSFVADPAPGRLPSPAPLPRQQQSPPPPAQRQLHHVGVMPTPRISSMNNMPPQHSQQQHTRHGLSAPTVPPAPGSGNPVNGSTGRALVPPSTLPVSSTGKSEAQAAPFKHVVALSSAHHPTQTGGQVAHQQHRRPSAPKQLPRSHQQQQQPSQPTGAPRRRNQGSRSRHGGSGGGAGGGGSGGNANGSNSGGAKNSGSGSGGATGRPTGPMVGTGEALLNVRAKGGQAVQAGDAQVNVPTEQDFDFQSELQKFDKEKEFAKEMGGLNLGQASAPAAGEVKKYDKSSFFDEISCDVLDRAQGRQSRVTRAVEMDVNMETFGTTGLQHTRRRGARGQGRNRSGGRNRGSGATGDVGRGRVETGPGGPGAAARTGGSSGISGGWSGSGRAGRGGNGRSSGRTGSGGGGASGGDNGGGHNSEPRRGGASQGRSRSGKARGSRGGQSRGNDQEGRAQPSAPARASQESQGQSAEQGRRLAPRVQTQTTP